MVSLRKSSLSKPYFLSLLKLGYLFYQERDKEDESKDWKEIKVNAGMKNEEKKDKGTVEHR